MKEWTATIMETTRASTVIMETRRGRRGWGAVTLKPMGTVPFKPGWAVPLKAQRAAFMLVSKARTILAVVEWRV